MGLDDSNMGAWLEAIALFETAREGDYLASARRLLAVYLHDESPEKLDRFIATSHRVGPPPLL